MKTRTTLFAGWIVAATFTFLNITGQPASAQIVIDNFSSTQSGFVEFLSDPPVGPIPSSISETGLAPGSVIGGAGTDRTTTVNRTSGGGNITAALNPNTETLTGGAGALTTGTLTLDYSSFSANLTGFLGVAIDVAVYDPGPSGNDLGVSVTLSDGVNTAIGTGQISGTGELIIPASAFVGLAGLDLSDIENIEVIFTLDSAQDFVINSIVALVPEPVTILLWSCGVFGFAMFWKRYGSRIRKQA